MSLCYREQRQLRGIEAGLFRSDSHLTAMLYVFGRLYSGSMPAPSGALRAAPATSGAVTRIRRRRYAGQRPRYQHPVQRGAHPASPVRRACIRPPAARPERTRPSQEAYGQQNLAGPPCEGNAADSASPASRR